MFWGKRRGAKQAGVAHDLVPQLEAVQAELATKSSHRLQAREGGTLAIISDE
jgi:hypothetical protein